ncbi:MAG: hypothetical protein V1799_07535 [bacterium]
MIEVLNPQDKMLWYNPKGGEFFTALAVESEVLKGFEHKFIGMVDELIGLRKNEPIEIFVFVEGGNVQDVTQVPEGVKVTIVDWDIEGTEEANLHEWRHEDGVVEQCILCTYEAEGVL